jgi:hypothetical protein
MSEVACIDIHLADSSGIQPKKTHEFLSKQVGGRRSLGHTIRDHHNLLRDMRKKTMEYGTVIAIMKYFERQTLENRLFNILRKSMRSTKSSTSFDRDILNIWVYIYKKS